MMSYTSHMWSNIKNSHTHRAIIEQPVDIWPQSLLYRAFILFKFDGIEYCFVWSVGISVGVHVSLSECFVFEPCLNDEKRNRRGQHTREKKFFI